MEPRDVAPSFGRAQDGRELLQSIFERAIDEGYEIRNPFRGIKRAGTSRAPACSPRRREPTRVPPEEA